MVEEKHYYCYLMASGQNGTLYLGVTNDLIRRVYEHQTGFVKGFSKRYQVHRLVWYEIHADIREAIHREKCIKRWNRQWKLRLIEEMNPRWEDLYLQLV